MRILPSLLVCGLVCGAAAATLAPVPPMGWNSWDAYGTTVTEAEVKANADFMAARLKSHGWQYIVVDIQWSDPNARAHGYRPDAELAMDAFGRLIPAVNRFPSSANGAGFRALADYIHAKGLKFGIHIMRGIPRRAIAANLPVQGSNAHAAEIADPKSTCKWNTDMYGLDMTKPGAQSYYDSIVRLYADWGVDYIKADDMAAPFHGEEIAALHRAIVKSGRPIVLSLSPGPSDLAKADFYAANANLWRAGNDLWDRWQDVRREFDLIEKWSAYARPGAWPDADMLPLGHIGIRAERGDDRKTQLTADEQRTLITLWTIARQPLMFGGDLPSSDDATRALITNDEVLAADQKATGSRKLLQHGDQIVWTSDAAGSKGKYVALFNAGQEPAALRVEWNDLGLSGPRTARDLWTHRDLGRLADALVATLPPHGSAMFLVR
jgi:alpha-galactosidase